MMKINLSDIEEIGVYIEKNGEQKKIFRYAPRYFYICPNEGKQIKEIENKIRNELKELLEEGFEIIKDYSQLIPDLETEGYRLLVYFALKSKEWNNEK